MNQNPKPQIDDDYHERCRKIIENGWYFIIRLSEQECEIQVCDEQGRAEKSVTISAADTCAEVDGCTIPSAVIQAVQRLALGSGDYCDCDGNRLDPFSMRTIPWESS